ncbi:hypothetical protein IC006_0594 [Sulfuracidifex tepidarius]|uniref:Uncharacterized protein n=1 Tax=Sulfuracidifex tepidarius TaxID=1294262 RepID=A0A510DT49_9CREN|nr:hypothetical protein [Sulfuracidifex tepidarius]BBG23310.1 hypothetical protein IC006_0594 [Sulfuracidifex tepidarius]BBG26060.1 hypothetical protein IC007_0565 [Sulfuracidifex tepidarius]
MEGKHENYIMTTLSSYLLKSPVLGVKKDFTLSDLSLMPNT